MTDQISISEQKAKLAEIKQQVQADKANIKPYFGFLFWQISEMVTLMSPEDVMKEAVNLTLSDETDAVYGQFMATYIELWSSSNDFHAASRFLADALDMSASELLEAKIYYDKSKSQL